MEITLMAGGLFAIPIGYYYGRDKILAVQSRVYNKIFGIKEDDYNKVMERKLKSI